MTNFEEVKDLKIYMTRDYGKFKFLEYNRETNRNHIDKLKESLSQKNDMNLNPVVVTPSFELVNGQHRMIAAKELGIPVYYVIDYDFTPDKLFTHNTLQKSWNSEDVLKYYVNQGYEQYMQFERFLKKYDLTIHSYKNLIRPSGNGGTFFEVFRTGAFKHVNTPEDFHVLNCYQSVKKLLIDEGFKYPKIFTNRSFLMALRLFVLEPSFNLDRFLDRLSIKFSLIKRTQTYDTYLEIFCSIYNYNMRKEINFNVVKTKGGKYEVQKRV